MQHIEMFDPIKGIYKKGDLVDINGITYELTEDAKYSDPEDSLFKFVGDTTALKDIEGHIKGWEDSLSAVEVAVNEMAIQRKINEKLLNNSEGAAMKDELKPASEMGFFEICAAVERGEAFEFGGYALYINEEAVETDEIGQRSLYLHYCEGSITRAKPWYEKLDGTEENGVWCKAWNNGADYHDVSKIAGYRTENNRFYSGSGKYQYATPVSKDLSDLLEKEFNND